MSHLTVINPNVVHVLKITGRKTGNTDFKMISVKVKLQARLSKAF